MLFELCERVQFISEGKLYQQHPVLQVFAHNIAGLPQVAHYMQNDRHFSEFPMNNKFARINDRH